MPNPRHNHKGHKLNVLVEDHVPNDNIQNGHNVNNGRQRMEPQNDQNGENPMKQCCMPSGCSDDLIDPNDPGSAVKVICNNELCTEGTWMHKECFLEWEQSVLSFLRSCGRARSWSEKQRLQNLWTKKGYDLAYKACDCKCGRGHIRKDLDYIPPPVNDNARKTKKHKKKNDKPMPVVSTNHKGGYNNNHTHHHTNSTTLDNHHNNNHHHNDNHNFDISTTHKKNDNTVTTIVNNNKRRGSDNTVNNNPSPPFQTQTTELMNHSVKINGNGMTGKSRSRNNSMNYSDFGIETEVLDNTMNSLSFSSSPVMSSSVPHSLRLRTNSVSSTGSFGSHGSSSGSIPGSAGSMSPLSSSPVTGSINGNLFFKGRKPETNEQPATPPSYFRHRQDLSAFNVLPCYKRNAYNIHIEDVQQDDETRDFVLNSLTTNRMTALRCVLCKTQLPVFDRFPLVDGTLFLSPLAYDQFVVQAIYEGRIQFLNAVCISCLQGESEANCTSCKKKWDGSSFVVGTMYTFDIFAAMPCCQKRLTCKHCRRAVIDASKGLEFYSRYSSMIICPYCKANDFHFIRPLPETFTLKEPICGAV